MATSLWQFFNSTWPKILTLEGGLLPWTWTEPVEQKRLNTALNVARAGAQRSGCSAAQSLEARLRPPCAFTYVIAMSTFTATENWCGPCAAIPLSPGLRYRCSARRLTEQHFRTLGRYRIMQAEQSSQNWGRAARYDGVFCWGECRVTRRNRMHAAAE